MPNLIQTMTAPETRVRMEAGWRIELLGRARLGWGDGEAIRLQAEKSALLLAYLVSNPQQPARREALLELLWPEEDPELGQNRLRLTLHRLRRQLAVPGAPSPELVIADRRSIGLDPDAYSSDVGDFQAALDAARQADDLTERRRHLSAAVTHYQGELLPGASEPWVLIQRGHLEARYLEALLQLAAALEETGELEAALETARRAVTVDPLREEAHYDVMRLAAALGQPSTALRQFQELERVFREELDETPSAEARALAEELRRSARTLVVARRTAAVGADRTAPEPSTAAPSTAPPTPSVPESAAPSVALSPPTPEPPARAGKTAARLPGQFTRFFGREQESVQLIELLTGRSGADEMGDWRPVPGRLVTMTGPGGSGKTRLAIAVAGRLQNLFAGAPAAGGAAPRGGVAFVPLADVTDAGRLTDAIAASLGLEPSPNRDPWEQLTDHLRCGPWLLVLDNFEQLVETAALQIRSLLEEVESLTCLVTSRRPLGIAGEQEFALLPLPTPRVRGQGPGDRGQEGAPLSPGPCPLAPLLQYPSVQLFVDRAQAAKPDFALTASNAETVAALCRKLEGMPLAIEMAAAWSKTLPPARILERLEHQFDLLVSRRRDLPPRQQSLRAAIQWSYDLLSPEQQACFARLSVFRGGWTLEAAEVVSSDWGLGIGDCGLGPDLSVIRDPQSAIPNEEVLPLLAALQDQSLILLEEDGEKERYRILEPLRQFAAEKLDVRGETDATRQRHAEYFLALAEAALRELESTGPVYWLDRLVRDRDNLRTTCDWFEADEQGADQAVRLASALINFAPVGEHPADGRARLERALSRPSAPSLARVRVLVCAGDHVLNDGDLALAQRRFEEALAIAQALGDRRVIADALTCLGSLARARKEEDRALSLYEESLEIVRALGDKQGVIHNLVGMGYLAEGQGDLGRARAYFEECRVLDRELGVKGGWALWCLGRLAVTSGDFAAAREPWETFLRFGSETGNGSDVAYGLAGCARLAAAAGEPQRAARLWGAAVAVFTSLGGSRPTGDWARFEPDILAGGAVLGEAGLADALAEGRALPVEEAVAYALGEGQLPVRPDGR